MRQFVTMALESLQWVSARRYGMFPGHGTEKTSPLHYRKSPFKSFSCDVSVAKDLDSATR